jgi:phosphatidylinositol glycan class B
MVPVSLSQSLKSSLAIKDAQWRNHFKRAFIFGVITHLVAVIFSEGFLRPDEHLGIMRLTGFKLGLLTSEQALGSWEYPAMIRPWLQPFFYYLIGKSSIILGIDNPFHLAFLFRFISAALAIMGSSVLALISYPLFTQARWRHLAVYGIFLFWFFPFIHARTSAENLASSLFLIGLLPLIRRPELFSSKEKKAFCLPFIDVVLMSVTFSLSFVLRYQMVLSIAPLLIWLCWRRQALRDGLLILLFITLIFLGTSLIDFWGYGEWTFTAWNYFKHNIILGKANHFGVDPWWYYFDKVVTRGIPPLGLAVMLAALFYWVKNPRSLMTWMTLPFFIGHCLISHKEPRFLFPIAAFAPVMLAWVGEYLAPKWRFSELLAKILIWQNIALLVIATPKNAHGPIAFYRHLYEHQEKIEEIITVNLIRDQLFFYQKNPIHLIYQSDLNKIKRTISGQNITWVLTDRFSDAKEIEQEKGCRIDYRSYPEWLTKFNAFGWVERSKAWTLFRCTRE